MNEWFRRNPNYLANAKQEDKEVLLLAKNQRLWHNCLQQIKKSF